MKEGESERKKEFDRERERERWSGKKPSTNQQRKSRMNSVHFDRKTTTPVSQTKTLN